MIVADTNLVATLLLTTSATAWAEAVLAKDADWTAPALWRFEFKNVLATQMRVLGLPLDTAIALFEKAEEVMIDPGAEIESGAILRLAYAKKLSAYDAEFVALALFLKIKLVTADNGILKAVPEVAVSPEAFAARR